jgi:hypothetical protein
MKKNLVMFAAAVLFAAAPALAAADKTWTGTISDSKCGAKHPTGEHEGMKMSAEDCTKACIEKGAKPVFVTGGKVYTIENPDTVKGHEGHKVKLTGEMKGNAITVSKVEMASTTKGMKEKK